MWAGYWWTCSHGVLFSGEESILAAYLKFDVEMEYGCHNTIDGDNCSHGLWWEYIGKVCFQMHRNNIDYFSEVINSTILRMQDRNVHSYI